MKTIKIPSKLDEVPVGELCILLGKLTEEDDMKALAEQLDDEFK